MNGNISPPNALDEAVSPRPATMLRRRRWLRIGAAGAVCSTFVLACLPTLLSLNPLRNSFLQWLAGQKFEITTQAASFGWFTPQRVEGLRFLDREGGSRIEVARFGAEQRLLSLLLEAPRLGTVTIDGLRLDLVPTRLSAEQPDPPWSWSSSNHSASRATFRAEVRDAAVIVRDKAGQAPAAKGSKADLGTCSA